MEYLRNIAKNIQRNCLDFFIQHGYDPARQVFLSEIDAKGRIVSERVHIIALSRLLYGFCISREEPSYTDYADRIYSFLSSHMTEEDPRGAYFIPAVSAEGMPEAYDGLNLWEQSYGFCGLVAYYEKTQREDVIQFIRRLFQGYVRRFSDADGTLCFNYSFENGLDSDSKQLQTLVYPITAFLGRLWMVDETNRSEYETLIEKNYAVAAEVLWNSSAGCPRVHFNRHFLPMGDQEVLPGHYFQLGWFFRLAANFGFLQERERYERLGDEIIRTALAKPFMQNADEKGFPESVDPATGKNRSEKRIWWEHAEWINALCFYGKGRAEGCGAALKFFERNFVDYKQGCEHFALSEDLKPLPGNKGELGKSAYHTLEMTRFLLDRIEHP